MVFNQIINRKGSACFKYDALLPIYGRDDLIPLWVADMDFAIADQIMDALTNRLQHPIFGYNYPDEDFQGVIRCWMHKRFGWDTSAHKAISTPSLMTALAISILSLTRDEDKILIQTPVYPPFHSLVKEHGRQLLKNPLILVNNRYEIDWVDFERKISQARMFILCNPHNPVGRVFSHSELERMHGICLKHNVMIFSDEIHADIVFEPNKHIPIATFGGGNVITGVSPAKSFNLAGMATAMMFAPDNHIAPALEKLNENLHTFMGNTLGITAFTAAYRSGETWLNELLAYLKTNRDFLKDYLAAELSEIRMCECEGTFLAWLDCRDLQLDDNALQDFFTNKARLALNPGTAFGSEGSGFMRLNYACSHSLLAEALQRLKIAIKDR